MKHQKNILFTAIFTFYELKLFQINTAYHAKHLNIDSPFDWCMFLTFSVSTIPKLTRAAIEYKINEICFYSLKFRMYRMPRVTTNKSIPFIENFRLHFENET